MVLFDCPRCKYTTEKKSNFINHIKSKKLCDVVEGGIDVDVEYILNILNNPLTIIERVKLEKYYNNNLSQTVCINKYFEPNTEYITEKECNLHLKDLCVIFLNMVNNIYFNPLHPENNSIFKTNLKYKFIKCFVGNRWDIKDQESVIDSIVENVQKVFDRYIINYEFKNKYDTDLIFKSKINKIIIVECYNNRPKK